MKMRRLRNGLVDTLMATIAAALLFAGWSAPAYADGAGMETAFYLFVATPLIIIVVIIIVVAVVVSAKNRQDDDSDNHRHGDEWMRR